MRRTLASIALIATLPLTNVAFAQNAPAQPNQAEAAQSLEQTIQQMLAEGKSLDEVSAYISTLSPAQQESAIEAAYQAVTAKAADATQAKAEAKALTTALVTKMPAQATKITEVSVKQTTAAVAAKSGGSVSDEEAKSIQSEMVNTVASVPAVTVSQNDLTAAAHKGSNAATVTINPGPQVTVQNKNVTVTVDPKNEERPPVSVTKTAG